MPLVYIAESQAFSRGYGARAVRAFPRRRGRPLAYEWWVAGAENEKQRVARTPNPTIREAAASLGCAIAGYPVSWPRRLLVVALSATFRPRVQLSVAFVFVLPPNTKGGLNGSGTWRLGSFSSGAYPSQTGEPCSNLQFPTEAIHGSALLSAERGPRNAAAVSVRVCDPRAGNAGNVPRAGNGSPGELGGYKGTRAPTPARPRIAARRP